MCGAPRIIVVGAGVVGLASAYYLRRAGAEVTVVAHGAPPSSTSRASLGILTHPNGDDGPYSRLYRDGHAAYGPLADELRDKTGIDIGWVKPGGIDLAFDEADEAHLEELLRRNSTRGCPAEPLSGDEVRRRVPAATAAVCGGLFFPDDHRVDPVALSHAFAAALERDGATLCWEAPAASVRADGDGMAVEAGGQAARADAVVLAAGAWTGALAEGLDAAVPVRPVRGQHCRFSGGRELPHILRNDGKYLVADGDDIIAGATVEDLGFATETTQDGKRAMQDFFARLLNRKPTVLDHRAGLRPKPKGGRPLVGPLQSVPNAFVASGHYKNGVLLAAITGQVLARWILEGDPGRDMSHFKPER